MSARTELQQELIAFCFNEYNWNGSGGLPIRSDVSDDFYYVISSEIIHEEILEMLPSWEVFMNNNGTLEIRAGWPDGSKLSVTFRCKGVITYIQTLSDSVTTINGVIRYNIKNPRDRSITKLLELFEWIIQEQTCNQPKPGKSLNAR